MRPFISVQRGLGAVGVHPGGDAGRQVVGVQRQQHRGRLERRAAPSRVPTAPADTGRNRSRRCRSRCRGAGRRRGSPAADASAWRSRAPPAAPSSWPAPSGPAGNTPADGFVQRVGQDEIQPRVRQRDRAVPGGGRVAGKRSQALAPVGDVSAANGDLSQGPPLRDPAEPAAARHRSIIHDPVRSIENPAPPPGSTNTKNQDPRRPWLLAAAEPPIGDQATRRACSAYSGYWSTCVQQTVSTAAPATFSHGMVAAPLVQRQIDLPWPSISFQPSTRPG